MADNLVQSGVSSPLVPSLASGDLNSDNRINPGETWLYAVSYVLTQANIDDGGNLVNTASVTTDQIGPRNSIHTQTLAGIIETYTMSKSAILADLDGDTLGDVGEVITYTFRFANSGNRTLANLLVTDPLPGLSPIVCANDGDVDGDIDLMAPGQVVDCTATYTIQASDIGAGSVVNSATSSATRLNGLVPISEDNASNDNTMTILTDSNFDLDVVKTVVSATEVLPNIVEIDYLVSITNSNPVTQTNLRVQDDVSAAVSLPAQIVGTASIVSATGFSGPGTTNPGFTGLATMSCSPEMCSLGHPRSELYNCGYWWIVGGNRSQPATPHS